MRNAQGQIVSGMARTLKRPQKDEKVHVDLTMDRAPGSGRIRLFINDPNHVIEDVTVVRRNCDSINLE